MTEEKGGLTEAEKALSNEISQKIASGSTFTSEYLETMLSKVTADKIPYILSKADDNGLTPLMHAARTNPNLVNLFVEKGADIYATDDNGKTLIDYTSNEIVDKVGRIVRKKIASDIQDAILEDIQDQKALGKRIENFKHGIDRNPKSINKQAKKNENANINENIGDYLEKRNELNPVRAALEKVKNFGDSIHLSKYPINTSDIGGKSDNLAGYAARLGNIQAVKILEEYKIHLEEGVVYNNNQSAQSIGKPDKVQNNKVQKMFGKVSRALSTMMSLGGSAPNAPNASEKSEKKKLR